MEEVVASQELSAVEHIFKLYAPVMNALAKDAGQAEALTRVLHEVLQAADWLINREKGERNAQD